MKQFKKLSALILSAVLLLAVFPIALSASAAVDATALGVQLDFANNPYAHNARCADEGIGGHGSVLYATSTYNYIDFKMLPGSAVVATFTVPEGAEAPIFQAAAAANGVWEDVTATEADGIYTIETIGAANSFLRISFPVCSEDYALTALAFDHADTELDFPTLTSTVTSSTTDLDFLKTAGLYDYTGLYCYNTGNSGLSFYTDGEMIFKTAPGSSFKANVGRGGADDVQIFVSPDGIQWTQVAANYYYCSNAQNMGYAAFTYYLTSIGVNNQFVKFSVVGASTSPWKVVYMKNVTFQKSTAVLPIAGERETTENDLVPSSSTEVDVTTLDVNVTFSDATAAPLAYACGYAGAERNVQYGAVGTIKFTEVGGYVDFKMAYNSPFVVEVRHWNTQAATAKLFVSSTGEEDSWTSVTPITATGNSFSESRLIKYTIPAIGGMNQYVRVQLNDEVSVLNYIRYIAFNYPSDSVDHVIDFSNSALKTSYQDTIDHLIPYGLYSYKVTDANANGDTFWCDTDNKRFLVSRACEMVFQLAQSSKFEVVASLNGKWMSFYASPTGEDGTWTQMWPVVNGTTYTLYSIGSANKFVKIAVNGPGGLFNNDLRISSISYCTTIPAAPTEVTVQDVALHTDVEATAINATVAYDTAKLAYKGYYGAAGTATVEESTTGTLTVSVAATAATKGDWIKLVFLPVDGVKGSAMVEVTAVTATGADLTTGQCPIWFDNPETVGNVLVEFDYGTTASTNDTVSEGAAGAELTMPAAPTREGYVFAGWYDLLDKPFTATTYPTASTRVLAKWVDADALTVQAQITANTTASSDTTNMRLVSTVDTLNYTEVGFVIQINNGTENIRSTTTVYSRLKGAGETYTPWGTFSAESRYFFAFNIKNIPQTAFATTITVKPYWVTLDGATVYGAVNELTVNELM